MYFSTGVQEGPTATTTAVDLSHWSAETFHLFLPWQLSKMVPILFVIRKAWSLFAIKTNLRCFSPGGTRGFGESTVRLHEGKKIKDQSDQF